MGVRPHIVTKCLHETHINAPNHHLVGYRTVHYLTEVIVGSAILPHAARVWFSATGTALSQ